MGEAPEGTRMTVAGYWDLVAGRYLALFRDEFDAKPYDRDAICAFAAGLGGRARILDAGCGPCGHVARMLADAGAEVTGIDISAECIALARQEQPLIPFGVMDMEATTFGHGAFDGVVAYYALHYQPKLSLGGVFREFARVLRPGGRLLVVAKDGTDEGWIGDPLGTPTQVYWCSLTEGDLRALAAEARFTVVSCHVRVPLEGEIASRRVYLTAERA